MAGKKENLLTTLQLVWKLVHLVAIFNTGQTSFLLCYQKLTCFGANTNFLIPWAGKPPT